MSTKTWLSPRTANHRFTWRSLRRHPATSIGPKMSRRILPLRPKTKVLPYRVGRTPWMTIRILNMAINSSIINSSMSTSSHGPTQRTIHIIFTIIARHMVFNIRLFSVRIQHIMTVLIIRWAIIVSEETLFTSAIINFRNRVANLITNLWAGGKKSNMQYLCPVMSQRHKLTIICILSRMAENSLSLAPSQGKQMRTSG